MRQIQFNWTSCIYGGWQSIIRMPSDLGNIEEEEVEVDEEIDEGFDLVDGVYKVQLKLNHLGGLICGFFNRKGGTHSKNVMIEKEMSIHIYMYIEDRK